MPMMRRMLGDLARRSTAPFAYRFGAPTLSPIDRSTLVTAGFHSQIGQDLLLDRWLLDGRQDGVFVDVGAHDGITFNNTLFLQNERNWSGILIEPNPDVFPQLVENRAPMPCRACAIGPTDGVVRFRVIDGPVAMLSGIDSSYERRHDRRARTEAAETGSDVRVVEIPMRRLDTLLVEAGIDRVTVLSIDVEGGERGVLDSIRLHDFGVEVVVIENNYRSWSIARRLLAQGYQLLCRLGWDEVYVPNPLRL